MKIANDKKSYFLSYKFVSWGLLFLISISLFLAFWYRNRDTFCYSLFLNVFSGSATGLLLVLLTNLKSISKKKILEILSEIEYLYGKANEYNFGQNNATYLLFQTNDFDYSKFLEHSYNSIQAMYSIFDKILLSKLPQNLIVYKSIREKYDIKSNHTELYMLHEKINNFRLSLIESKNSSNFNHQNAKEIHTDLIRYLDVNEQIFSFLYSYRKQLLEDIGVIDNSFL